MSTLSGLYDPTKTFNDNFDHGPFKSQASVKDKGQPKFKFLGHELYSPFGIAAGPLPTSKHVKYAFDLGFDVVCYKTQRSIEFPCNDFPNVLYVDVDGDLTLEKAKKPLVGKTKTHKPSDKISITNSFGNPSKGPDYWIEDMIKAVAAQGKGQLLIASVVGTIQDGFSSTDYYDDFASAAAMAVKAGAPAIEINLSCPNVANEGIVCYTYEAVVEIARRVKAKIGQVPLIAKVGYYSTEQQELLETIVKDTADYLDAISAINTIPAAIVDENGEQALPGPNRLISGVCGSGIKWAGLDMVKRLSELRSSLGLSFEIIGIGGVMNASDFKAYQVAGADVVQSATGSMWNANLAQEIKSVL